MSDIPKILVFIPIYNCEKQIPRTLNKFTSDIQKYFSEILVVDNGSKDNSVESATTVLREIKNLNTTLVKNKKNINLGGSHKVAFEYAIQNGFTHVVVIHGDDQGNINDIIPYLAKKETYEYSALLGARFHPKSKLTNYSMVRKLGNIAINIAASLISFSKVYDMGSGINLFSVDLLKNRFFLNLPNDLTFNYYVLIYLIEKKCNFKFFPHTWEETDQISNAKIFKQGLLVLKILKNFALNPESLFSNSDNITDISFDVIYKNHKFR